MSGPEPEPSSQPTSGDGPTITRRRKATRFYRQPLGVVWLIGLVLIPLLLAVIGYGMLDRSRSQAGGESGPSGALPMLVEPTPAGESPRAPPPGLALAPLSIARQGDGVTLNGNLPDPTAKRTLLDAVVTSMGDDVNVFDNLQVVPGIKALDCSAAAPVFEAAAAIPDFTLNVSGDTVTLAGTAANADDAGAVEDAATQAWPNVNIVSKLEIASLEGPPAPPGPR